MTMLVDRRTALRQLGVAGVTLALAGRSLAQTCGETPSQTLGPYYLDLDLVRRDIREGKAGVPLRLELTVVDAGTCVPFPNVVVEVWHADAAGVYSGFAAEGTLGETFCRGGLGTNAAGVAEFLTIYPGWYPGRAVHVHFRITVGTTTALVSQLYFPDGVTDTVYTQAPYASRGTRSTRNPDDGIFAGVGDESAVLVDVTQESGTYVARLTIGILSNATTTTTTPNASTTTTTLPPSACGETVDFVAARCRITALRTAVTNALPDGRLESRLVQLLDERVAAALAAAAALAPTGRVRRIRAKLQRSGAGIRAFRRLLASRLGRQGTDATVRGVLDTAAVQVATTLAGLHAAVS